MFTISFDLTQGGDPLDHRNNHDLEANHFAISSILKCVSIASLSSCKVPKN